MTKETAKQQPGLSGAVMGRRHARAREVRVGAASRLGDSSSSTSPVWWALAVLLVVGGIVGSWIAASSVAHRAEEASMAEFMTSSAQVASTLQLAIRDEESLIVHATAFALENPSASDAEFAQWVTLVHAFDRYPELKLLGRLVIVDDADLQAFATTAVSDPAGPSQTEGSFQVIPPGDRPFYCFIAYQGGRTADDHYPMGLDVCAAPAANEHFVNARDSGIGSFHPIAQENGEGDLVVQVPSYRGAVVPATVAARREAFMGMIAMTIDPTVLLDHALQGHDHTAVTLRYHDVYSDAEFSAGSVGAGARSNVIDLQNGWTVETNEVLTSGHVPAHGTALLVLLAGAAWTVLLAAFVLVLATSRSRAVRLVAVRTGELRHQALHDALTGLPNRALIMDRIEQLLARNRRHGTSGAALFVDLDDFKNVNDTLGHEAGDRLLMAVAARLTTTLRDADTIGRMGGDEFVVLIDGATSEVAPELVAERLLEVMRQPFALEGKTMPLTVNTSVGIAMGDRATPGDLLRDADVALYHAKGAGKNCYELFHTAMHSELLQRLELEYDLRSALNSDQFRLVYQPIYNLEDLALVGVEALLRWHHPIRGIIQPDDFIPILEQTGQIQEVGRWVLRRACEQMAKWHASGDRLDISVNVSARQLDHETIIDDIRQALSISGLDPGALIIEITETALMPDAEETTRRLRAIKALGVRIAVDDFGTGYSSLAYLQRFPVDSLKIDRVFTNAIATSPESQALIGTLVQLGKDLGLRILAEGVETTDQMDHLRTENVNEAQGFLMSRPLDPDTLETQLLAPIRPKHVTT